MPPINFAQSNNPTIYPNIIVVLLPLLTDGQTQISSRISLHSSNLLRSTDVDGIAIIIKYPQLFSCSPPTILVLSISERVSAPQSQSGISTFYATFPRRLSLDGLEMGQKNYKFHCQTLSGLHFQIGPCPCDLWLPFEALLESF